MVRVFMKAPATFSCKSIYFFVQTFQSKKTRERKTNKSLKAFHKIQDFFKYLRAKTDVYQTK